MIYYFSGTGNSQWVAEQLAGLTDDAAVDIPSLTGDGPAAVHVAKGGVIGVVFPIYAWAAPAAVVRFLKGVAVQQGAFAYAVCTCGDEAGNAMRKLRKVFPYASAYSLTMPNNYIPMFDVDSPALVRQKIASARARLPEIAADIRAKKPVVDVRRGAMPGLKTALASPAFNAFARSTRPFTVDGGCTGCGLCAQNCPSRAIRLTGRKPVWTKRRCAQCLGCINRCPARSIQYGGGTKTRGRYCFHED